MIYRIVLAILFLNNVFTEIHSAKVSIPKQSSENEDEISETAAENTDDTTFEDQTEQPILKKSSSPSSTKYKFFPSSSSENHLKHKFITTTLVSNEEDDETKIISNKKQKKSYKSTAKLKLLNKLTTAIGNLKMDLPKHDDGNYDLLNKLSDKGNPEPVEQVVAKSDDDIAEKALLKLTHKPRYEDKFTLKVTHAQQRPKFTKLSEFLDVTSSPNPSQSDNKEFNFKSPSHSPYVTNMAKSFSNSKTMNNKSVSQDIDGIKNENRSIIKLSINSKPLKSNNKHKSYNLDENASEIDSSITRQNKWFTRNKFTTAKSFYKSNSNLEEDTNDNETVIYNIEKHGLKSAEDFDSHIIPTLKNTIPHYNYDYTESNISNGENDEDSNNYRQKIDYEINLYTSGAHNDEEKEPEGKTNTYNIKHSNSQEITDKTKRDETSANELKYSKNYLDKNNLDLLEINKFNKASDYNQEIFDNDNPELKALVYSHPPKFLDSYRDKYNNELNSFSNRYPESSNFYNKEEKPHYNNNYNEQFYLYPKFVDYRLTEDYQTDSQPFYDNTDYQITYGDLKKHSIIPYSSHTFFHSNPKRNFLRDNH